MTIEWLRPPSSVHKGWRYRIGISDFLSDKDDLTPDELREIVGKVSAALESASDFASEDSSLRELVEELRDSESLDEFNNVLDALYDWGDGARVIIG